MFFEQHFKRLQPKTDEPPVQKVSVRVKTLATILDEQQLQLIRERLLEYSQSGTVDGDVEIGTSICQF